MARNQSKKVPKQITKLLVNTSTTIHKILPDKILEDYAGVSIHGKYVSTKEIYVVYHSNTLNRLVWPSIPLAIHEGYEVRGSDLRLVEFLNFDIPNKKDRLILILIITRNYNFVSLEYESNATIYMPKRKRTFKDITTQYYCREQKNRGN